MRYINARMRLRIRGAVWMALRMEPGSRLDLFMVTTSLGMMIISMMTTSVRMIILLLLGSNNVLWGSVCRNIGGSGKKDRLDQWSRPSKRIPGRSHLASDTFVLLVIVDSLCIRVIESNQHRGLLHDRIRLGESSKGYVVIVDAQRGVKGNGPA